MARKRLSDDFAQRMMAHIEVGIYAGFGILGRGAVNALREALENLDANHSGRLSDSMHYATKGVIPKGVTNIKGMDSTPGNPNYGIMGGMALSEDRLTPETRPYFLKAGTRNPYAKWVNFGSGPHVTNQDSAEFVAKITEWGERYGMTVNEIEGMILRIRAEGTDPKPFLPAGQAYLDRMGNKVIRGAVMQVMRNIKKRVQIIGKNGTNITMR